MDDGMRRALPVLSLFMGERVSSPSSTRRDRRVRSDSSWEELPVVTDAVESAAPLCTSTNLYHRGIDSED